MILITMASRQTQERQLRAKRSVLDLVSGGGQEIWYMCTITSLTNGRVQRGKACSLLNVATLSDCE